MKFLAWIDLPTMSIGVSKFNDGYKCVKFIEGSIVRGTSKEVANFRELKAFLLTLPGSSKQLIEKALFDIL